MSGVPAVPWHRPMSGRDPEESHRSATPLELFFDLCFVVAVAAAAATLHHDLALDHLDGLVGYAMVFFAIWWAWVNYSWFASAYDTGDIIFRLLTFVVMTGVLVVAAGTPRAAEDQDFGMLVVGYVDHAAGDGPAVAPGGARAPRQHGVRRCGTPSASPSSRSSGSSARCFFGHDTIGWVLFVVLAVLEMAVPYWAEHAGAGTPWHRHHIAERYELFTIIVLGEVILATTPGDLEHPGRARPRCPAAAADRGRAADGVLDVVDLLQAAHGRLPQPRDRLRVRLRPLLRVRLRGRGRRLPGRAGRRHRAPRGRSSRGRPCCSCVGCSERLPARDLRAAQPRRPRALDGACPR